MLALIGHAWGVPVSFIEGGTSYNPFGDLTVSLIHSRIEMRDFLSDIFVIFRLSNRMELKPETYKDHDVTNIKGHRCNV